MLERLAVENLALFRKVTASFEPGLNVLTGPTGAGKSLLIRALRLALGERADYDLLPEGREATITARFRCPDAFDWPEDVEPDETIRLRRRLTTGHRSRSHLNDAEIRLKTLRRHRAGLVDFHGQHEDQAVFQRDFPRRVLDRYGEYGEALSDYRERFGALRDRERELDSLTGEDASLDQREELLRYQVRELEDFEPGEGEWETIEERRERLESAETIERALNESLAFLEGEDGITRRLAGVENRLEEVRGFSGVVAEWSEELPDLRATLEELRRQLREVREDLPAGQQAFEELMDRRGEWTRLARKHDVPPEALHERYRRLKGELENLERREERVAELRDRIEEDRRTLGEQGEALRERRRDAARTLETAVTRRLEQLNLERSRFEVRVEPREEPGPHGADRIRWMFSSHQAHEPGPLEKRVSGGEISRVLLALKAALADADETPVLVFDEVDAGISGEEAGRMGDVLAELAEYHQVLCITHLPLVAARADHHLRLVRRDEEEGPRIRVESLDESDRIDEMSRLLSGDRQSEASRRQAEELIRSD